MTKKEIISNYYFGAVAATKNTGIFPQTLITQLILEAGYNLSKLATQYFNFFGIKATPTWKGKVVSMTTKEYNQNGVGYYVYGTNNVYSNYNAAVASGAAAGSLFRVYNTVAAGFAGYVSFLKNNPRYKNVFKAKTPQQQFEELQKAGYATSPTYSAQLLSVYNSIKDYLPAIAKAATGGAALLFIGVILYKTFTK